MKCKDCKLVCNLENDEVKGVCTFPPFPSKPIDVNLDDDCQYCQNLAVELKDFHYVMNGDFPDDFEVCLIVDRRGQLSAGCWDTGLWSTEGGKPGAFRQSRGGVIEWDDVWAWLPIEKYDVATIKKENEND